MSGKFWGLRDSFFHTWNTRGFLTLYNNRLLQIASPFRDKLGTCMIVFTASFLAFVVIIFA